MTQWTCPVYTKRANLRGLSPSGMTRDYFALARQQYHPNYSRSGILSISTSY